MAKYQRLIDWIIDYFPDKDYTQTDIREWAEKEVPAWNYISKKDQKNILDDWREFVKPDFVQEQIEKAEVVWKEAKQAWKDIKKEFDVGIIAKIKGWFKRLF